MPAPDVAEVLAMRVAGERARMADLRRLLPYAAADAEESRRRRLDDRISGRATWAASLPTRRDGWQEWHDAASDAEPLVEELVALLMTRLLRAEGLDGGTFAAAEAFLAELTRRADVSALVLGHSQEMESLDHTRASVSLRFPGSRIWDLPFLGHELGHHAIRELRHIEPGLSDKRPLSEVAAAVATTLRDDGETPDRAQAHSEELVADVVATIACGPTYPVACLCLRVPTGPRAAESTPSHPAWRDRIATMREVLDALTDETGLARYHQQRESVVDPLVSAVLGSLPAGRAAGEQAARRGVMTLRRHRPGLVYAEADLAIEVAARLGRRERLPTGISFTAVLDGVWRWRLGQPTRDDDDAVAELVVSSFRHVTTGVGS